MTSRGGERLMVGFDGLEPTDTLRDVLHETGARSVILFSRNVASAAQTRDSIAGIRALVDWPLLIAVDQEGGAVVRVTEGATVFPGAMALGAADDVALAHAQGRESGRQLAAIGFDLNLAPVVDLQTNPRNPGIGIRSLGSDRSRAAPLARALIEGHAESDVLCCLKHFPGKGAASVDAHIDLPVLALPREEFEEPHVAIFRELLDAVPRLALMTTHVIVQGLDREHPATLSRRVVTDLVRGELGFDGLVIADDLEMGAIVKHWGVADAAAHAAIAGHDILPVCHEPDRQVAAARAIDEALGSGKLDAVEHAASLARIERFSTGRETGDLVDTAPGDRVATEIARRAVHLFADPRGLLPIAPDTDVAVLAARPHSVVGVEEAVGRDFQGLVAGCLRQAGIEGARVVPFEADLGAKDAAALRERAASAERVVLLSWNALGQPPMRSLLEDLCRSLSERLIVVHMRNPFDQALVPDGVTTLTAFGYRVCQLEALSEALSGKLGAQGRLPAPVQ